MSLVMLLYLLNALIYTAAVYFVLLILEKTGKRDKGTRTQRVDLAARWAVGFTLLQLCTDTVKMMG